MHTLTFIKCEDCTLAQFLESSLFDSNFDITNLDQSYPAGKQVRVPCNIGYSGFFKLTCEEGKWQSRGDLCKARPCGHPGDAPFADFHLHKGDDFVFGSQVVYTCHKGYQMVSRTNSRQCMAGGWDGVVPVCEAQQCPEIYVESNVNVVGDPVEATFGNVVRFSCKSSSEILIGPTEIYCDERGEWSGPPSKCEEIKCTVPLIENGFVNGDQNEYKEYDVLLFECNSKYKPSEDRPSKCTKAGIRAEWTPTPRCEIIKCQLTLPALEGTSYDPPTKSMFSPGDTVKVMCGEQHWISNHNQTSAVSTCLSSGEWSIRPICKEVTCNNRRHNTIYSWYIHWGEKILLGRRVNYACKSGYKKPDGFSWLTCTRSGWTPDPPCQEKTCPRHELQYADIINDKQEYKLNEQANYVCKNMYEGQFTRTCYESGWYPDNPIQKCRERSCQRPDISNAHITYNSKYTYRSGESLGYQCTMDNNQRFYATCDRGDWSGLNSCPGTKPCPKLTLENGFAVGPFSDMSYYTCNNGYKLRSKGWWGEAKCDKGIWTGVEQCVEASMCGDVPAIPNAEVKLEAKVNGRHQSAVITCKEGYQANISHLTCHEGEWHSNVSSLKTICKRDPSSVLSAVAQTCGPPSKVYNAVIMTPYQQEYLSDSQVTYQCRAAYKMEGEDTIRCHNGKWEEKNITCAPLSCDLPPADAGIIVKGLPDNDETVLPDRFLTFSCDDPGKHLNGSSTLICGKDGQWDHPFPTCEDITCKIAAVPPALTVVGLPQANEIINIGHKLRFHCSDDNLYTLEGTEEVQCLETGEWNNPFPTCSEKCQVPYVPINVATTSSYGTYVRGGQKLRFTCQLQGQFLQGKNEVTCLRNGKWSDPFPKCGAPLGCGQAPPLIDGDIKFSVKFTHQNNEQVQYTCKRYFFMEGTPYKTCVNGEWRGDIRCLKPCTVDREVMNKHHVEFKYRRDDKMYSSHNDEIEFRCQYGRRHVGNLLMRQTCLEGVIHIPTCQ
ncbi:complement factor H-like [Aulostomus maculatus]